MPIRITAPIIFIIIYCSVIFIRNGLHSHAAYEAWASQDQSGATHRGPEQQRQVDNSRSFDKGAAGGCGTDCRLRGGDHENGGPVRHHVRHVGQPKVLHSVAALLQRHHGHHVCPGRGRPTSLRRGERSAARAIEGGAAQARAAAVHVQQDGPGQRGTARGGGGGAAPARQLRPRLPAAGLQRHAGKRHQGGHAVAAGAGVIAGVIAGVMPGAGTGAGPAAAAAAAADAGRCVLGRGSGSGPNKHNHTIGRGGKWQRKRPQQRRQLVAAAAAAVSHGGRAVAAPGSCCPAPARVRHACEHAPAAAPLRLHLWRSECRHLALGARGLAAGSLPGYGRYQQPRRPHPRTRACARCSRAPARLRHLTTGASSTPGRSWERGARRQVAGGRLQRVGRHACGQVQATDLPTPAPNPAPTPCRAAGPSRGGSTPRR